LPHWRRFRSTGDRRTVRLPAGLRGTAPDQPVPAFLQDRDLTTGVVTMTFSVTRESLRPGVLFGATAPFEFRAITVEEDRLVLAEYDREGREVLAETEAVRLVPGREFRLRVEIGAAETRARLWQGDAEEPGGELAAAQRPRLGAPGVLTLNPPELEPAELSLSSFGVQSDGGFASTPPMCAVAMTGTPVLRDGGAYAARVHVWSAWPASVVFERSTAPDRGPWEEVVRVDTDSPPFVARATVSADGSNVVYWRARLRSRTSAEEIVTPTHELRSAPASDPLVLLAASCVHLLGPPPNEGFTRLEGAAPEAPALLVFQGDIGYPNNSRRAAYAASADFFADRFQRVLARPDFAELRRSVPVGFTLDDHDYGPRNNAHRKTVRPWAVELWNRIHADPSNSGYYEARFGDVQCLTLDVRRYADWVRVPDEPRKTRLGEEQFEWMENVLRESDARLFVVFCGGTFARRESATGERILYDTFVSGWPDEYRRALGLFSEIQEQGRRVLLVSGDAHGMRIHHHPDPLSGLSPGRAPVVEFICSGLRADLWEGAPPDDPTLDVTRNVLGRSGGGMIVVDPPTARPRRITLRAIGAGEDDPVDLFPPLVLPFEPGGGSR
ncbi:MAG: alkaline phosphatase D family protein, partial [Gaiellaceae bacterium]